MSAAEFCRGLPLAELGIETGDVGWFLGTLAASLVFIAISRAVVLSLPERGGYRGQLVLFGLVVLALLAILIALPLKDSLKGDVFSLVGIVVSAAVALSSTTFLGNLIAGGMLRTVSHFDLGDWIRVGEHFGRVTERGLLHTEIQTADRDLLTLPNLLLATQPVKVVRASGTIIAASVGLGYDTPHARVDVALLGAAADVGLTDAYVAVDELGDFAVTYRVAGKLAEVERLLSRQTALRRRMLDRLHEAGIEIMSPSFMTVTERKRGEAVIPTETGGAREAPVAPEAVAFDKADRASQLTQLKATLAEMQAKVAELEERLPGLEGEEKEALEWERARISGEAKRLAKEIEEWVPEPKEG